MKRAVLLIFVCSLSVSLAGQIGVYQHGTVVRMHMGDCMLAHHGFMVALGGPAASMSQDSCPEYTMVSNNVVFVLVGKSSNQLIPLAETIDFRIHKNELAVRVDDAKHETMFMIKEMMVRSDWDRLQRHIGDELRTPDDRESAMATRN